MKLFQVAGWGEHFENNKSKERDSCSFVCIPNKQAGLGFARIMARGDGAMIYGIWCLLLGALSRQRRPRDGWLTHDGHRTGTPWAPDDLGLLWRRPTPEIETSLTFLSSDQVKWILSYEITENEEVATSARRVPAECPPSAPERKKEGNEEKGSARDLYVNIFPFPNSIAAKHWRDFAQMQINKRKPYSPISIGPVFEEFRLKGEAATDEALTYSIKARADRVIWPPNGKIKEEVKLKPLVGPAEYEPRVTK